MRTVRPALPGGLHHARRGAGASRGGTLARSPPKTRGAPCARRFGAHASPGGTRMSPANREAFFRGLARAIPEPRSELEYSTPYELLVAVVLSAQATDKSVNLATARLFPVANTPAKIAALGGAGLEDYIRTIGLYRGKAKNVIALSQILMDKHGGQGARPRE